MTTRTSHLQSRSAAKVSVFFATTLGTLLLGFLSGTLSGSLGGYGDYAKPALTPPDMVFPIVWSILYVMMGVSFWLTLSKVPVTENQAANKRLAVGLWLAQLFFNLCWPFAFFTLDMYGFAFVWLVALAAINMGYIVAVYRLSPAAAWLHIPYELWLLFAGYLNLFIAILN